ncbi:hypothetical protein GGH96_001121 [Coemansia sp. RSA 1972]|nr:hypothetical protein GGH96_001121 [Coemansia sp. RSA 1972]
MVGVSASPHPTSETTAHQPRRRQAPFIDRVQAGHQLARNLSEYAGRDDVVIVSVSRGGAVVGSVVASTLGAHTPHMYYKVQAIPCPRMPRLSLGSVAGDGSVRIDSMVAESMNISSADPHLLHQVSQIDRKLRRDQRAFVRPPPTPREMCDRVVIVVDDVVEAGDTMREAVMHLRHSFRLRRVVAAAPVCLADLRKQLQRHVDAVVDIVSPLYVGSVSQWYAEGDIVVPSEQLLLERMFSRTNGRFDNS